MPFLGHPLADAAVVVAAAFVVLWLVSLLRRDASVVDPFWGTGFLVAALVYFLETPGTTLRRPVVLGLTALWALRLSGYLLWRNWGEGEDYRYREMRDRWGKRFPWVSLFTVFLLQAAILWVVSLPLWKAMEASRPAFPQLLDLAGIILWSVGLVFEAGGDLQLARFKADPANAGKVMDRGLWRYTRHPNYFGDACIWWGFGLVALSTPGSSWVLLSPALMTLLLLKISGVSLLEQRLEETKPKYRDYVRRTSAFLPWPPKKDEEVDPG